MAEEKIDADLNFELWTKIINNGQKNKGIYLHKFNSDIIMKCENNIDPNIIKYVKYINSIKHIFPIIHNIINYDNYFYTIMEKFRGDITSLYLNEIPILVLKKMELDMKTACQLKTIFDIKTPALYPKINESEYNCLLKEINNNQSITFDLYDLFINNIFNYWNKINFSVLKKICKNKIILLKNGYRYNDDKLDNYAYNLYNNFEEEPIIKFKIFIIDWSSGLSKLGMRSIYNKKNNITRYCFSKEFLSCDVAFEKEILIRFYNNGPENFSINGQSYLNIPQKEVVYNDIQLSENINKIFLKKYIYNYEHTKVHSYEELLELLL